MSDTINAVARPHSRAGDCNGGLEPMEDQLAAGAVVRGSRGFLLIRDRFGKWTLPKGKVDPGESPREAAVREVKEETAVDVQLMDCLGVVRYGFWHRGRLIRKVVTYYLGRALSQQTRAQEGEVSCVRWVTPGDLLAFCDYENNRSIYTRALRAHSPGSCAIDGQGSRGYNFADGDRWSS